MATGAGTGTPANPAYAVTAQQIIDQSQSALNDSGAAEFSEAQLLSFLNEAIREYSQHLPRISTADITAVLNTRTYSLPIDTLNILSIEYPVGEDPPQYLQRAHHHTLSFPYVQTYDMITTHDLTQYPQFVLSFDPATAETIRVTYQHPHNHSLTLSDNCTVPSVHHHILIQYILFAAARFQLATEQANPTSNSSLLMSQLAANMRRLELTYLNALNRILYNIRGQSAVTVWNIEPYRPIY